MISWCGTWGECHSCASRKAHTPPSQQSMGCLLRTVRQHAQVSAAAALGVQPPCPDTRAPVTPASNWFPPCSCRLHNPPTAQDYGKQLEAAAAYIAANRVWLPRLVWMDTPPQHFNTSTGKFKRSRPVEEQKPCRDILTVPGVWQVSGGAFFRHSTRAVLFQHGVCAGVCAAPAWKQTCWRWHTALRIQPDRGLPC